MSFNNFIPTIWAKEIQKAVEGQQVFREWTNTNYAGDISEVGDSVRILSAGRPTIKSLDYSTEAGKRAFAGLDDGIGDAELPTGSSITLNVNQLAYYHFLVGDIDKEQAVGNLQSVYKEEAVEGLADTLDTYIASFANENKNVYNATAIELNVNNVIKELLNLKTKFFVTSKLGKKTPIRMEIPYELANILGQALIAKDTDNSERLARGEMGLFGGIEMPVTNNVYSTVTDNVTTFKSMLRTKRALAFVNPFTHCEAYRPEKGFSDAIKGFTLYDAKIVRPKEILTFVYKVNDTVDVIYNTKAVTA